MSRRRINKREAAVALVPFKAPEKDRHHAWNWALEHRPDLCRDYVAYRQMHIAHYGFADRHPGPTSMAVLDSIVEAWESRDTS